MVYYNSAYEVCEYYAPHIGKADRITARQGPDTEAALAMANLRSDEAVLDLGTGAGRALVAAKSAIGSGVCVGVDVVAGFLDIDVATHLRQDGKIRAPDGYPWSQVFLLNADVTWTNLPDLVMQCVGRDIKFDVIFAMHVFNAIAPAYRQRSLSIWKKMLAPGGRLILTISPCFSPAPVTTPFSRDAIEAFGCYFIIAHDSTKQEELIAEAGLAPKARLVAAVQASPNRIWAAGRRQVDEVAAEVGMRVTKCHDIGKGDGFGLEQTLSSPPSPELHKYGAQELQEWNRANPAVGLQCRGRLFEAMVVAKEPSISGLQGPRQSYELVAGLQGVVRRICDQYPRNESLTVQHHVEHAQVGFLVELRDEAE